MHLTTEMYFHLTSFKLACNNIRQSLNILHLQLQITLTWLNGWLPGNMWTVIDCIYLTDLLTKLSIHLGMNIMGVVVASVSFGIALSSMKAQTQTLLSAFNELSQIMMKITSFVIWLSPIGIFFLTVSKLLEMDDILGVFAKLGLYFLTVVGGICFHGFVLLPSLFFVITRKNPIKFIGNMGQAIATAFGTGSSSAALPVTIQCLEQKNGIDPRVARFVLPIGATINMDGTAL